MGEHAPPRPLERLRREGAKRAPSLERYRSGFNSPKGEVKLEKGALEWALLEVAEGLRPSSYGVRAEGPGAGAPLSSGRASRPRKL